MKSDQKSLSNKSGFEKEEGDNKPTYNLDEFQIGPVEYIKCDDSEDN